MPFGGIIRGTIICIPFWLIVILMVKGVLAMELIIFVGLVFLAMILFIIPSFPHNTKQDGQDRQLLCPATRLPYKYNNMHKELKMTDNGGTRSGFDRRKFEYTAYIPEKRSGMDRRKGSDRRSRMPRRRESERRAGLNHRELYPIERRDAFRT